MNNIPLVSILIPVFNREQYIAECIQSALEQSYSNFEVVIVDNASSDRTATICQYYASTNNKIRFFANDTNIGPVGNWQRCIREARGDIVKLLFSDDMLLPDCVSHMISKLTENVAFVYSACLVGTSLKNSKLLYSGYQDQLQTKEKFTNKLINGEAPVSPGAILLRLTDLRKYLYDNFPTSTPHQFAKYGAGSDVMVLLLTAEKYLTVFALTKPLVFFRAHPGSLTIQNEGNAVRECYLGTLSLFLKNKYGKGVWLQYLTLRWLIAIKESRKVPNPIKLLQKFEGSGSLSELLNFTYYSFKIFFQRIILRRKIYLIKRHSD